jgi:hypothetical protein
MLTLGEAGASEGLPVLLPPLGLRIAPMRPGETMEVAPVDDVPTIDELSLRVDVGGVRADPVVAVEVATTGGTGNGGAGALPSGICSRNAGRSTADLRLATDDGAICQVEASMSSSKSPKSVSTIGFGDA